MKKGGYFLLAMFLIFASCTSNTIYEKPKNLIPKDSMVALLTDMYIASSAKSKKNKFMKREENYVQLVYEKYKIDTIRFDESNSYYTSKIEEYTDLLKRVRSNIDSIFDVYEKELAIQDSINSIKKDSLGIVKKDTTKANKNKLSEKLVEKNSKLKDSSK